MLRRYQCEREFQTGYGEFGFPVDVIDLYDAGVLGGDGSGWRYKPEVRDERREDWRGSDVAIRPRRCRSTPIALTGL